MLAVVQLLKDGFVTHIKSNIGHISTLHGTLPTHSIACQSKTASSLTLPKLIEDETITPTIMYGVTRNPDGSVPSLESFQRFGIMPGNLSNSEFVKALQEKPDGIGLLATRLLPIDIQWLFQNTLAVIEISVRALVEHARVDVHTSENGTFHVFFAKFLVELSPGSEAPRTVVFTRHQGCNSCSLPYLTTTRL